MDADKIKTILLLKTIAILIMVELMAMAANAWLNTPPIFIICIARIMEAILFLLVVILDDSSLEIIGLKGSTILYGLKKGIIWSVGFGVVAAVLFIIIYLTGNNPLMLIRSNIPEKLTVFIFFLLIGGIIAPVTEEIFFRGILYGYLRRFNVVLAIILSAVMFAFLHWRSGLPVTQFIGGLVFAVAFEKEKSLMTPVTIHILGNLAIFTLSTPWFQGIFIS
jgi:membrane protease YdiL (CAAX protease family)